MTAKNNTQIQRQNILNNTLAIQKAKENIDITGILYNSTYFFTTQQIADFYEVDLRTIKRVIENNRKELEENGYHTLTGKELSDFKKAMFEGRDINVPTLKQTSTLSLSTFRTVLNFAMLLTQSDKAKEVRQKLLDISMNSIAEKTGGNPTYINQRDSDYLTQAIKEETERQKFTNALDKYVQGDKRKYGILTNQIYVSIFKEKAHEYRDVLKLKKKDRTRQTMYSEVLLLIASFESGLAYELERAYNKKGEQLTIQQAKDLIYNFSRHPLQEPLITNARKKMSSRDLGLRQALHQNLKEYLEPLTVEEFDKFIGEQSKSLEQQIQEHKDVFERLKDK